MRRILVPLDGSPEAEGALAAVMPLVRAHPAALVLLRVVRDADLAPPAASYLAGACAGLEKHGLQAGRDVCIGRPRERILEYARAERVDLIAMSTHGRSGLSRLLLGSVAEHVLRHADVPLLVCRPGTSARERGPMLVALDGSARSETILPEAVDLARALDAAIEVVHVSVPLLATAGYGEVTARYFSGDPGPYAEEVCRRLRAEGVSARPVPRFGPAAGEIVRRAEESGAGMACMTSHGRTGLARLLLGSVAEEVMRHAPCPVLIRRTAEVAYPLAPAPPPG